LENFMNRAEKQEVVGELVNSFGNAQVALCADARGLTVAQITELRKELMKVGARGKVVRNTLVRLSIKEGLASEKQPEVERFVNIMKGPSFVIFGNEDPVAPAKVLSDFLKKGAGKLSLTVKGAWLDGVFLDEKGVETLSKLPGKTETIAKLLALLNAPATQLLRLVKEPAAQTVRVIGAQMDKLKESGANQQAA